MEINTPVLLYVVQLVDRLDTSLVKHLRLQCETTSGNCVLVVVHANKVPQIHLQHIQKEYEAVSGLTRSKEIQNRWRNKEPDVAVEHSKFLFVESELDDSGPITRLKIKNMDQFITQVESLW